MLKQVGNKEIPVKNVLCTTACLGSGFADKLIKYNLPSMDGQKVSEDSTAGPQNLLDFYIDLIENSKNLLRYYLSDDTVLDWFGQTVKGQKNVSAFIKTKVIPVRHFFKEAKPVNKIGFRDTHQVRTLKPTRRILRSAFLSPPRPTLLNTPKKQSLASTSARRQIARPSPDVCQLNGKNNKSPTITSKDLLESPRKRQKVTPPSDIDVFESENDIPDVNVKYLTAEGHVEFHRPSLKKLQSETKWQRPCKIHIAYDSGKDVKDSSFYLIIYEGNVKCRRNLMKDFEAEEPEN